MTFMKFILQKRGRKLCRVFQIVDIPMYTVTKALQSDSELLLDDLQNLHGACLDADTASDALGSGVAFLQDHDLHGTNFHTLAAGNALLLVDHVHAGLGILRDCLMLANLHALAALDADIGLSACALGNDLDAAQIRIELLVESSRTSLDALQTCHALGTLFNSELLHIEKSPLYIY